MPAAGEIRCGHGALQRKAQRAIDIIADGVDTGFVIQTDEIRCPIWHSNDIDREIAAPARTGASSGRALMFTTRWIAIAGAAMLLVATAHAEEPQSDGSPAETDALESLLNESGIPERWQSHRALDATSHVASWSPGMRGVDFEDRSAYAQVSKIRSLSLLTLGQFGQKRLFLGVNQKGLLGLHFNAFPHFGDERYLELARMPYLDDAPEDDGF